MKFVKEQIFSKRYNKDIEIETYNNEQGAKIVSTTSLRTVLEDLRVNVKISTSYTYEYTKDEHGDINWALVNFTLKDDRGFVGTFMGESTPETRLTTISRQYPMKTAYNRALSNAVISYLNLPGKVYSDTEIEIPEKKEEKRSTKSKTGTLTAVIAQNKEKAKKNTLPPAESPSMIFNVPSMDLDDDNLVDPEQAPKPILVKTATTTSPVYNIEPVDNIEIKEDKKTSDDVSINDNPIKEEASPASDNATEANVPNGPVSTVAENSAPTPAADIKLDDASEKNVSDDTVIGMGIFAKTTIAELFEAAKTQEQSRRFINMVKNGEIATCDPTKQAILQAIANKSIA